jgi:hypothetical protein
MTASQNVAKARLSVSLAVWANVSLPRVTLITISQETTGTERFLHHDSPEFALCGHSVSAGRPRSTAKQPYPEGISCPLAFASRLVGFFTTRFSGSSSPRKPARMSGGKGWTGRITPSRDAPH